MAQISGLFRIGRDAEVRFSAGSGDAVVGLSLAFNYYDKNAEKNRASQWVEAVMFGKRAESLAPYLLKGGLVYATINDPHVETYSKKDGTSGVKLTGKIGEIELAGGKSEGGTQRTEGSDAGNGSYQPATKRAASAPASGSVAEMDDDIPF